MSAFKEHEVIWLQPWCDTCERHADDRTWCQDKVWDQCEGCDRPPVKYVLAPDQPKPERTDDT